MNRLNHPSAFSAVFDKGQRFHLKAGLYLVAPNGLGLARLGMVIAKKKLPLATSRNRLKRLQRENFRAVQQKFVNYDVVFVAHPKVAQLCQRDWFRLCQSDWQTLAKRL